MALRFFRKHKKWGHVLLLGAVFAMVTFGSLATVPELFRRMRLKAEGEQARFVLESYGEEVSRVEAAEIRWKLRGMANFHQFVRQAFEPNHPLSEIFTWPRLSAMMLYASPMPGWFATVGGTTEGKLPEEAVEVFHATAILLKEAEMAGVVVTDEMARAHRDQWRRAGVKDGIINGLTRACFFPSNMQDRPVSPELLEQHLIPAIRQEMVLSIYLSNLMSSGKAFEEDVDEMFRLRMERAEIRKVDLRTKSYLSKVDEPSEEAIQTHFEQYKDRLAEKTENLFGCKIPNRVKFEYLKLKVDSFKADVQVTDEEIRKYYDQNKDPRYVIEEEDQEDKQEQEKEKEGAEDAREEDQPKAEPPAGDKEGKEPEDKPGKDTPAGDEDEKAQDGGGAGASTDVTESKAEPAEARSEESPPKEQPASTGEAAAKDEPAPGEPAEPGEPATAEQPAEGETADTEKPEEKPEPERKFKPLEEVRDSIKSALLDEKAMAACRDKAEEVYRQLLLRPQLSLESMADGKYVAYRPAGKLYSQEDIRLKLLGIGNSYMPSSDPQAWRPIFFSDLVFRIEPFADDAEIFKGRPRGILADEPGNCYIFVVTDVAEAEVPATVDPVRHKVVQDLKKEAAYKLAEEEAEALLALAKDKGLEEAVKEKDLKVAITPGTIRRPFEGYEDPMAIEVFKAVDTSELRGQVGTAKLSRVTVFEIKNVVRVSDTEYKQSRPWVTGQTVRLSRQTLLRKLIDPDRLMKRSGFVDVTEPDEGDKPQDGPDRIGKQETQADETKDE